MKSSISSLVLALSAPSAMAFAPSSSSSSTRQSTAVQNTLRDMASYPDEMKMMDEFEQFDRNGAFSRSPQGGMGGRPGMMGGMGMEGQRNMQMQGGNPNPFARGGNDRMYTQDGFDPYSAYGNSFGMSQSDNRRGGPGPRGGNMMGGGMYGGGPEMINGVRTTDTMGGFEYDSRTRSRDGGLGAPPGMPMGGEYFDQGGMGYGMGGFDGPMMEGPMDYGYPGQFDGPQGGEMMGP